jgi:hypothetical protein
MFDFTQLLSIYKKDKKINSTQLKKINLELSHYNVYELNLLAAILFNEGKYLLSKKYLLIIIKKKKNFPPEIYYNLALILQYQKKKSHKYFNLYIKKKFRVNSKNISFNKIGFKSYNLDFVKKKYFELKKKLRKKINFNLIFGEKENINNFYKCFDLNIQSEHLLKSFFKKIFSHNQIRKDLLKIFKKEYSIYWFNITRTYPCKKPIISFKWHCDYGIKNHLKILLYLNLDKKKKHSSNTVFLDSLSSKKLLNLGYNPKKISKRISSLTDYDKNINFKIYDNLLEKKNTIIFSPYNQIHKGIPPKTGYRDLLTIYLAEKKTNKNHYSILAHSLQRHKFRVLIPEPRAII